MEEGVARVEALLEDLDEKGVEAVRALLDLYGEGLARIAERVDLAPLTDDELVTHLLLLHDLHPVPVETRVQEALDGVRPYLQSHGGEVELLNVDEGVVRLALQGSCSGCPSSTMTLKLAIEDAIRKAAPEVEEVVAEGVAEAPAPTGPTLLQLEVAPGLGGPAPGEPWTTAGTMAELSSGGHAVRLVAGERVLFARIEANLYAYRDDCPGCHGSLEAAHMAKVDLACPGCGRRYDVIRAGRCLDEPELYLEPIPLLTDEAGLTKVALRSAAVA